MPLDRTPQKDNPAMNDKEAEANKNRRRTMTLSEKKDDDNCGHCLKIVRKGISCDDCEKWYHANCQKLKQVEIDFLSTVEDTRCIWLCDRCKAERGKLKENFEKIQTENEDMKKLINENRKTGKDNEQLIQFANENRKLKKENTLLSQENKQLIERMTDIENEVKILKSGKRESDSNENSTMREMSNMFKEMMNTFAEQARKDRELMQEELKKVITEQRQEVKSMKENIIKDLREDMKEEQEMREKQNKVVMFNIEESWGEGRQKDQEEMDKVMDVIRDGIKIEKLSIKEIRRIGVQQEGKMRPIMVELENVGKKWEIVKNATNLKNANRANNMNKVIVVPDLTWKQREKDRELRDQLKEKRDNGERGWYINRGQLKRESSPIGTFQGN